MNPNSLFACTLNGGFYGFKVYVITTGQGISMEFLVTACSILNNIIFQVMYINIPNNGDLYGDSTTA